MSGGDPKEQDYQIQINYDNKELTEDVIQEIEESQYRTHNIVDGFNVHVQYYQSNSEFEVALRKLDPCTIILYEPYLEYMRIIESYNAERVHFA